VTGVQTCALPIYMPFYYSIEGLRKSLIPTTPTSEMVFFVIILLALSILFITLGVFVLHKGLVKAKKDGSLMFY
jgi:ABC-type polysaccharide/polyol phosphate export permease